MEKKTKDKNTKAKALYKPSKALIDELENLFDFVPPDRLCKSLRKMFMLYLYHEKHGADIDLEQRVLDLYLLLDFLDAAEEDKKKWLL